jgi:hypothetical protein
VGLGHLPESIINSRSWRKIRGALCLSRQGGRGGRGETRNPYYKKRENRSVTGLFLKMFHPVEILFGKHKGGKLCIGNVPFPLEDREYWLMTFASGPPPPQMSSPDTPPPVCTARGYLHHLLKRCYLLRPKNLTSIPRKTAQWSENLPSSSMYLKWKQRLRRRTVFCFVF